VHRSLYFYTMVYANCSSNWPCLLTNVIIDAVAIERRCQRFHGEIDKLLRLFMWILGRGHDIEQTSQQRKATRVAERLQTTA
jgi:hypothetical protein